MGVERLCAFNEKDLVDASATYIANKIAKSQQERPGNFLLGLSGTEGSVRRGRAADVFAALGAKEVVDWNRVRLFLVDEMYSEDATKEDRSNAALVRTSLLRSLSDRGIVFPESHFTTPNPQISEWEERASDYEDRLRALFEANGSIGPNMVTLALQADGSIASIYPNWYREEETRWQLATSREITALCTECPDLACPRRIAVNLRVIRAAETVLVFIGSGTDDAWEQIRETSDRMRMGAVTGAVAPNGGDLDRREVTRGPSSFRLAPASSEGQLSDAAFSPLAYVMKYNYICVAQLREDEYVHLNFVVLGAGGDLARKKTFPALFQLCLSRALPTSVSIVGCDDPAYHPDLATTDDLWKKRLLPYLRDQGGSVEDLQHFRDRLQLVPLRIGDSADAQRLNVHLRTMAKGRTDNRVFYLALPPFLFEPAVRCIRGDCWSEPEGFVRVVVEKPFGHNLRSAKELGAQLSVYLQEKQIYRIDHYLAKTMVLNIMTLRFANREFGRLFHADSVANVRVTFKEDIGVEGRAGYFDKYGILRDVMQNHLLQLLTLVLMEAPASLHPEDVRDEKVKVLKQIRCVTPEDCVVGQYAGYQDDVDIQKLNAERGYESKCPTFATCVLYLDNERWSGVPLILKAGKSLEKRSTIVRLQFKRAPPSSLFGDQPQNDLVMRIQPDEAIYYRMLAKAPGLSSRAHEVRRTRLDLDLQRLEVGRLPEAYEKLIHDVVQGESHNFVRADEVEQGWRIFDPLLQALEAPEAPAPRPYERGSRGPWEADSLIDSMGFRRYTATGVPGKAEDDFQ